MRLKTVWCCLFSGDRGLAGAYNMNIVRHVLQFEKNHSFPIRYITVGKKGRDMPRRRRKKHYR